MRTYSKTMELIRKGLVDGVYPGVQFSTGDKEGEQVSLHAGYRALYPAKEVMEPETLFDMASVTKVMATTLIAFRMIDTGILRLSDKLSMYFDMPTDKKDITVWHIMTHTSGLPAHILLETQTDNPSDVFRVILQLPLLYAAGVDVTYSCLGYILLGRICESIGGADLNHLAKEWVFDPLGLTTATYCPNPTCHSFAKTEYDEKLGTWLCGVVHDENARFMHGVAGNAGVFANRQDCVTFALLLANKGMVSGHEWISRTLFHESIMNHTVSLSERRGLGFAILQTPYGSLYGHNGFTGTSIWVDAETSQYMVLLTNRVHPSRENQALTRYRAVIHDACIKDYRTIL